MAPKIIKAQFIRFRAAAYLGGRGLSYGCANDPIVPRQAMDGGKYSINADCYKYEHTDILDKNLDVVAKATMDHVFIGARENPPVIELASKLKIGGHIVIHAVSGESDTVREVLRKIGQWQEKDVYFRDGQMLGIWKLLTRNKNGVLPPKPKAVKRACIARYGAIGDMIMVSPLIRQLAEDGYEVTMNITPYCAEVLKHNPYVHNIVLQERDIIPNPDLGEYWKEWMGDYDKYINLSESVEGKLLKVEYRRDFYTTKAWRDSVCQDNYYDNTMRLGGYPDLKGCKGELYFSKEEEDGAKTVKDTFKDRFLIMWSLKGTSHHKVYPLLEPVLREWLQNRPEAAVMLVGAEADKQYQFEHPQVVPLAGVLGLRDVFCLTKYVDLVVGPETAVTNAAGCFDTPKLIMLTHSKHGNLCKYFENDYCLEADVVCGGCHQLHYSLNSCPVRELASIDGTVIGNYPLCTLQGFPPNVMMKRLDEVYFKWKAKSNN